MLSNAYFLAKFRFDTTENEPAKKLQILQKNAKYKVCAERAGTPAAPTASAKAQAPASVMRFLASRSSIR